jgi:hypothetical protein
VHKFQTNFENIALLKIIFFRRLKLIGRLQSPKRLDCARFTAAFPRMFNQQPIISTHPFNRLRPIRKNRKSRFVNRESAAL